jgi:hypothetical protein
MTCSPGMGPQTSADCGRREWEKKAGSLKLARQIIGKPNERKIIGGRAVIPRETFTRPWKRF